MSLLFISTDGISLACSSTGGSAALACSCTAGSAALACSHTAGSAALAWVRQVGGHLQQRLATHPFLCVPLLVFPLVLLGSFLQFYLYTLSFGAACSLTSNIYFIVLSIRVALVFLLVFILLLFIESFFSYSSIYSFLFIYL